MHIKIAFHFKVFVFSYDHNFCKLLFPFLRGKQRYIFRKLCSIAAPFVSSCQVCDMNFSSATKHQANQVETGNKA